MHENLFKQMNNEITGKRGNYIQTIKQRPPRSEIWTVCTQSYFVKSRQISGQSQAMDSAIGEHLLTINSFRTSYEDDCFSVLHRARDKIHLSVLEAIYIPINRPHLYADS